MAAALILSPITQTGMAARRQPLASVPNAVNSPFRNTQSINGKRTRAQAGHTEHGHPPAKKQALDVRGGNEENVDPRRAVVIPAHDKLSEQSLRRTSTAPTALDRKLAAARDRTPAPTQSQHQTAKAARPAPDNTESIRLWQKHYKRLFPTFVFYFDNIQEDVRVKLSRLVHHLGSREEKFFSKAVTHVVTTRAIPAELVTTSPDDDQAQYVNTGTVMQSTSVTALSQDQRRTTSLLDANLQRRTQTQLAPVTGEIDARRSHAHVSDILIKARELGIKIWAYEKLNRMLNTMFSGEPSEKLPNVEVKAPASAVNRTVVKPAAADGDLEQLLRNEKITGPADRDPTVAAQDMCTFRGNFMYIHDMDERTKPVMLRDYPKPVKQETGKWPQFRMTAAGRCPFIEDPSHVKRLHQQDLREQEAQRAQQDIISTRRTRGTPTLDAQPLAERQGNLRRSPRKAAQADDLAKPLGPPQMIPAKRSFDAGDEPPLFGSAQVKHRGLPRTIRGEPVASGMQHSNITSAIRSQAVSSNISSTAPGLTRRITDSKEVTAMRRKVLERGASVNSNVSVPSSYMNDMRAAINDDPPPPPRAAKRRAQETLLGVVHEDEAMDRMPSKVRKTAPKRKVEKEAKPGYCENCRDKFEDFDEHILTRKHRKFAMTTENWKELDALLVQLGRKHKDPCTVARAPHETQ
nr:hypothetical protein B0A51_08523 [Rachicladosporium sp. CCFEE 5018]